MNENMDNLIIIAGVLAGIRAYWVFNLLRQENELPIGTFTMFFNDKNKFSMYLIIRPFFKKMKNEKLRRKINYITIATYICFIIGFYFAYKKENP